MSVIDKMYCPRRREAPFQITEGPDEFRMEDDCCTYCGSLNPDTFMARLEARDIEIGTTDKDYKVYVHNAGGSPFKQHYRECPPESPPHGPDECEHWATREISQSKFYFQHLSLEQRKQFVELFNLKRMRFAGGYGFRFPPFFMKFQGTDTTGD